MSNETIIRFGFFIGILIVIAIWELLAPRRSLITSKKVRWFSNLTIVFLNPPLARLVVSILPVGMAVLAQSATGDC